MSQDNLIIELLVEELPPKALKKLGESFSQTLFQSLMQQGLASAQSVMTSFATPRRMGVHITNVRYKAGDKSLQQKLMPVSVGLNAQGEATPALVKKLHALGLDEMVLSQLKRAPDGKAEALFYDSVVEGVELAQGIQIALEETIAQLPIPKLMSYQLQQDCALPGWSSVKFVRPAHGLLVMHGAHVVKTEILGLKSGNSTLGHRFEAKLSTITITHADEYENKLLVQGAVVASFTKRRNDIVEQLQRAAKQIGKGVNAIEDDALLDEVTGLVERPNVLICEFDQDFLAVPQECLILTMKANQEDFPVLDSSGKLTHQFLVVSNISPNDPSAVIGGNERVVRPRLADAKFFFDQDRKKTLATRVDGLSKVVYHNKLGSQGDRTRRVRAIAASIAALMPEAENSDFLHAVDMAAQLAKTDLLTDMVGEFPELQGIMGAYYARHDGLSKDIAQAIEDHYKPRFAGDELPQNAVGLAVALADKFETLVGMFGIGNLPTGDRDPFALRRHALGIVRMLSSGRVTLDIEQLIEQTVAVFGTQINDPRLALIDFIYDRLSGSLREQSFSAKEVESVMALRPRYLADVSKRLEAVRLFATLPESQALAAANKRIGNILKKAPEVDARVNETLLQDPAEKNLYMAVLQVTPQAQAQFEAGDYTGSLQSLAALRAPVDQFFDDVMVNAEDLNLRLNRQGLLKTLHLAMNRVADLSCLAT